jgi:hypothetical protein
MLDRSRLCRESLMDAGKPGADAYRTNAREDVEAPPERTDIRGDHDLVIVYGLVWTICAVDVVSSALSHSFGMDATFSALMLFLLPWLVRRTIWSIIRHR